ncbi:thioesterase family protein [Candidatus Berkiella aquae]|uniref:Thioesterase family protein n=1 Tax=Candidatus Berkiella aquae TaxID=295108 RepID=A0A0Q9YUH4_9GAMM|nr:thioesterase family protein [Candidatus Berkiella aquae]MCS5712816.1 thioesterase family protein [Candidatus Berkiella aquae]
MFDKKENFDFPDNASFVTRMNVRINDVNYANHLDYSALLEMVGNARSQFFRHYGCTEIDIEGVGGIVKKIYVDYLDEASFNDELEFKVFVSDIKGVKANLLFLITNLKKAKEVARVAMNFVFFDAKKGKLCSAPEKFIHMANSHQELIELRN